MLSRASTTQQLEDLLDGLRNGMRVASGPTLANQETDMANDFENASSWLWQRLGAPLTEEQVSLAHA